MFSWVLNESGGCGSPVPGHPIVIGGGPSRSLECRDPKGPGGDSTIKST